MLDRHVAVFRGLWHVFSSDERFTRVFKEHCFVRVWVDHAVGTFFSLLFLETQVVIMLSFLVMEYFLKFIIIISVYRFTTIKSKNDLVLRFFLESG